MISVLVCGAGGKMGQEVMRSVWHDSALQLVGAVDISHAGQRVGDIIDEPCDLVIQNDLAAAIASASPDVVVDFTTPKVVYQNACTVLQSGTYSVIGTTGLTAEQRDELDSLATANNVAVLVAPNFSLGAVLMMQAAAQIARYLPETEIIELHHNHKYDAPSGTAKLTAEKINQARSAAPAPDRTQESIPGARGADWQDVRIHSVRLPGYVAHQEVLFGGNGEILTIRHDSLSRSSFMPGVLLACKHIQEKRGLVYGLEHFL